MNIIVWYMLEVCDTVAKWRSLPIGGSFSMGFRAPSKGFGVGLRQV